MDGLINSGTFQELRDSFAQGITQSEMMQRANCPRKWFFRYVKQWKRMSSFSWALLYGDVIHRMLEVYYRELQGEGGKEILRSAEHRMAYWCHPPPFRFEPDVLLTPQQEEEQIYWRDLAMITMQEYLSMYKIADNRLIVSETEKEYEYIYEGFKLRGKVDLVVRPSKNEGLYILDHKTASEINRNMLDGWQFRFQFLFYAWLYWRVTKRQPSGIYVNILKKPLLRQKAGESYESFIDRIHRDMRGEPDKYFRRERIPLTKKILPEFERFTLQPQLTQLEWCRNLREGIQVRMVESLLLSANSDHCMVYNRPCEFFDLCQNSFEDFNSEYIKQEVKHPELQK